MSRKTNRLTAGDVLPLTTVTDMFGAQVSLVPQTGWIHLQFLRFAGCPICNLHLRQFAKQRTRIEDAAVREVLVFHSSGDELRTFQADLPFITIADPDKLLYAQFGVEKSSRAVVNPRVWGSAVLGMVADTRRALQGEAPPPPLRPRHGELGLPADFLIGSDGAIRACQYGRHAGDQWSISELLSLVSTHEDWITGG